MQSPEAALMRARGTAAVVRPRQGACDELHQQANGF